MSTYNGIALQAGHNDNEEIEWLEIEVAKADARVERIEVVLKDAKGVHQKLLKDRDEKRTRLFRMRGGK